MGKRAKRPKFGDIYEIKLSNGVAYLQYILRHTDPPQYGPVIRILPGVFSNRIDAPEALADHEERFLALYWLPGAINDADVEQVGHREVPTRFKKWPLFKNHPISKWRIWDGTKICMSQRKLRRRDWIDLPTDVSCPVKNPQLRAPSLTKRGAVQLGIGKDIV